MNSVPKTVIRQRRHCDLNPGPSAPESSTLITRLPPTSKERNINTVIMRKFKACRYIAGHNKLLLFWLLPSYSGNITPLHSILSPLSGPLPPSLPPQKLDARPSLTPAHSAIPLTAWPESMHYVSRRPATHMHYFSRMLSSSGGYRRNSEETQLCG